MFLVGGGILTHDVPPLHHWIESVKERIAASTGIGGALEWIASLVADVVAGMVAGAVALAVVSVVRKVWPPRPISSPESV